MAKYLLGVTWKDHAPGQIVEAELREIGALVDFGYAKLIDEVEAEVKKVSDAVDKVVSDAANTEPSA